MATLTTTIALCLLFILPVVLGQQWTYDGVDKYSENGPSSQSRDVGALFNVQRRRNWCARWGDYCLKDAKVKLAQCCSGLRCMCSQLWKRGCVCRNLPTFG